MGDLFSVLQVLPLTAVSDFNHSWTCFNDVISSKRLLNTVHAVSCLQGSTLPLLLNKIVWFAYSYYRTAGGTEVLVYTWEDVSVKGKSNIVLFGKQMSSWWHNLILALSTFPILPAF